MVCLVLEVLAVITCFLLWTCIFPAFGESYKEWNYWKQSTSVCTTKLWGKQYSSIWATKICLNSRWSGDIWSLHEGSYMGLTGSCISAFLSLFPFLFFVFLLFPGNWLILHHCKCPWSLGFEATSTWYSLPKLCCTWHCWDSGIGCRFFWESRCWPPPFLQFKTANRHTSRHFQPHNQSASLAETARSSEKESWPMWWLKNR